MRYSFLLIFVFTVGLFLAYGGHLPIFLSKNDFSNFVLYGLMFVVGISFGGDKNFLSVLRQINWKIILVPLIIIVGSLFGTAIYSLTTPNISLKEAMAVGAGLGYYSLSSVLISELYNQNLGTIALVSNLIRELFTLVFTPLLVVFFGKLSPIASGAATSMDSTLPIITRYSGKEYTVIAIFSGAVLTILVPFLVSIIIA